MRSTNNGCHPDILELFGRFTTVCTVYYSALKYIFIWASIICFHFLSSSRGGRNSFPGCTRFSWFWPQNTWALWVILGQVYEILHSFWPQLRTPRLVICKYYTMALLTLNVGKLAVIKVCGWNWNLYFLLSVNDSKILNVEKWSTASISFQFHIRPHWAENIRT